MRKTQPALDFDGSRAGYKRLSERRARHSEFQDVYREEFRAEMADWQRSGEMTSAQRRVIRNVGIATAALMEYAVGKGYTQVDVENHVIDLVVWFDAITDMPATHPESVSDDDDGKIVDPESVSDDDDVDDEDEALASYLIKRSYRVALSALLPIVAPGSPKSAVEDSLSHIYDALR